jgi:N-acetylglucosaminyl-diphospho-decaprenol L-rhamnosyltransferase
MTAPASGRWCSASAPPASGPGMSHGVTPAAPVTVVVVSFNTRELLLRCLHSLEPEVRSGRAAAWVVDNGSTDGSVAAARLHAPWAHLVAPGTNLGFGRAVNLVAAQTRGPWLVCANADVALAPGALEALLAGGRDRRVGCVAPRLLLDDGRTQHSVHSLPTIPFTLAFNLGLQRLSRRLADRMLLDGLYDADRGRRVPWAIGALLLLRREAFDGVGGFDERQWIYGEDLDLGWRLRDAGWLTFYEPRARVRHTSGASTEPAFGDQRRRRFTRETYAVIGRRRGRRRAWATAAINVAGAAARVGWMTAPAIVSPRWRTARRDNLGWLSAHRQGIGSSAPAEPPRPATGREPPVTRREPPATGREP